MSRHIPPPGAAGSGWDMDIFTDGAPPAAPPAPDPVDPDPSYPDPSRAGPARPVRVNRVLAVEGPRGYATRSTVWLRYALFFLEIVGECAVTEWATRTVPGVSGAGRWMLIAAMLMLVTGAVATVRFSNERNTIIREARKYVLAIALRPGAAIAVFMWMSMSWFQDTDGDAFAALMHNALPIVFFCTIFIPALVFLKMVFGIGSLNRSMEDNQALVARWTRQDDLNR